MNDPRSFEAVLGVGYVRPPGRALLFGDDGATYSIPDAALAALKDPVRGDPARVRLRLTAEEGPRS